MFILQCLCAQHPHQNQHQASQRDNSTTMSPIGEALVVIEHSGPEGVFTYLEVSRKYEQQQRQLSPKITLTIGIQLTLLSPY